LQLIKGYGMNDLLEKLQVMQNEAVDKVVSSVAKSLKSGVIVVSNPKLTGFQYEHHVSPEIFQKALELLKLTKNPNE